MCQCITQTKEDFVSHIKSKHLEDVDDEVLNTLYSDLKKARRKMELVQIQSKQEFQVAEFQNPAASYISIQETVES